MAAPTPTGTNQQNKLSREINKRMGEILKTPRNQKCADCPARRPLWVSFLVSPIEADKQIGVLICQDCAQHHLLELGEKRTMIKYLKFAHEWTEHDVEILEDTGNEFCNSFYEAKLSDEDYQQKDFVLADAEEEEIRRSKFIKKKYKKLKFFDEVIYHKEVLALLQRRHKERIKEKDQEGESRRSRRNISHRRGNNNSSSSSYRERSRSRGREGGRSTSGYHSSGSRSSRSRSGHRRSGRQSYTERRSSDEKTSSSDHNKEHTGSHSDKQPASKISSRLLPDRTPSMKMKDLRSTCRERQGNDRREMLQKSSSMRLSRPSSKVGDELSSCSAHTPRGNNKFDGNNSTGNVTGGSSKSLSGANAIESGFMASLGMVSSTASPSVHVDTVNPFLSENEDGPRRRDYAVPDVSYSDTEGVAMPLRRRLSNRELAVADASGQGTTTKPQTRLQRRLSNQKILAQSNQKILARQAEGAVGGDGQPTVRRRLSNRNLMANADTTDPAESGQPQLRVRRRLSNRNLSAYDEGEESGQQQPPVRRRLSNRNLTGMSNDLPDGTPAANGQQPRIRRKLSNRNLRGNAPPGSGGQTPVRRRLSNPNLVANSQPTEGQPQFRRRLSNRNLMENTTQPEADPLSHTPVRRRLSNPNLVANSQPAEGQPQARRRLSNRNLMENTPQAEADPPVGEQPQLRRRLSKRNLMVNDQEVRAQGDPAAGGMRRRLSNRNLVANEENASAPENGMQRRDSSRNLTANAQKQGDSPAQPVLKRRLSRRNIMDNAAEASSAGESCDVGGPINDSGEPIEQRVCRYQDLLAKASPAGTTGASPAKQGVLRRLYNRDLTANAPDEEAIDGKAPPVAPGVRIKRGSINKLVASASDADESDVEPNQRMQRRLSNRSLKAASEQQQPTKITRKRSDPNLLGRCANGPPVAANADESDAESIRPVQRKLSNKRLQSADEGGQRSKRVHRKRSDPDLLGKCANGPPLEDPPQPKRRSYTKSLMEMVSAYDSDSDSESDEERKAFMESFDAPTSPSSQSEEEMLRQ